MLGLTLHEKRKISIKEKNWFCFTCKGATTIALWLLFCFFELDLHDMKRLILFIITFSVGTAFSQEPYSTNQSYTYDQLQTEYGSMAKNHPNTSKIIQFGSSDYGENIQLFMISKTGAFSKEEFKNKTVLLINNAIHPGEPCGVDASVKLAKDLLSNKESLPEDVVICIIPMYNVGGGHNRSCCSRANQNGPLEYGFRGNAKNLDLNRDFIKSDSKNTRTFYKIFQFLEPNVFVDTHTSNGADYQHVMTLITSQINKMQTDLGAYTKTQLNPFLFAEMDKKEYPMVPYVHQVMQTPDDGIQDYLETPRYSTGYTNLFNCISYVTEAHMLKPYEQRVEATYEFLNLLINYMDKNTTELLDLKKKANANVIEQKDFDINWKLDTNAHELIEFRGYEAEFRKSEVTGLERLSYNREKPWIKKIKYFNTYTATSQASKPDYYIIPQAWTEVIIRMQMSDIAMYRLKGDEVFEVETYFIDNYETSPRPYEGHYLHKNVELIKETKTIAYHKGDYVIPCDSKNNRFIVESLEPNAPDSYFAWNFFDAILQQKEWFSAYVFEDKALELLNNDQKLKADFNKKKKEDLDFAKDAFKQLYFIYKRSDNYERTHNRYPVTRMMNPIDKSKLEKASSLIGT